MRNRIEVPVSGVVIDISDRTLNKMLFGPDYKAPASISKIEHRMFLASNQRPWLVDFSLMIGTHHGHIPKS